MLSILGLTLEELSLKTYSEDLSLLNSEYHKAEALRFGESVLGRELIYFLPLHRCERGCDSFELALAEEFAAKRPRNSQGLKLFLNRFRYRLRKADGEMLRVLKEQDWTAEQYLEAWLKEFLLRGVEVLHGDLPAQELLGEGYAFETWSRFEAFLNEVHERA